MKKILWWDPIINKKEYKLVNDVLRSNFPNEGKLTKKFEKQVSDLLNIKYVIAVTNATSAMFLSLKALGIGHGDEVIVPDLTFIATANAVEMTGAKAVLTDINPETLTIDINQTKKVITKRTKAIIPVHVSGRASDMDQIIKLAKKYKLYVVEDAAEAFMSKHKGKYLGTYGVTGCFSLSPAKTITTGQGGLIVTNDTNIYKRLVELKDQGRPVRGTGGDDIHYSLGFNFKFTDLQAAVGLGQLTQLKIRMKRLKRNHLLYKKYLTAVKEVNLLKFDIRNGELPQWCDGIFKNRDGLVDYLKKQNIDSRKFWLPVHTQAYYKKSNDLFPNSTSMSLKALWLPSAYTLTDQDIIKVCTFIKKFYEKK
jgi:perosamine synthetase